MIQARQRGNQAKDRNFVLKCSTVSPFSFAVVVSAP